ncbi:Negative elongation factor C/D [Rhizopus azygosporus]|uniref:Negative elongation factor C/D n=1 Tax=Rhizopus azygosporus TaxID=86630 RepID=A0A367K5Z4_RHIAZ|nr:Negative elongation factor C/D [Rhizopus azygosporus]
MQQPLRISTPEEHQKALSQTDAILEQNIYNDGILEYINHGGSPLEAVNLLSESYLGIPSMCNVTAASVDSVGLDSDSILRRAIRQQLKERFDPKRCDDFFMRDESHITFAWLDILIQDSHWRQTMYELLEKHPSCAFLNFAILRMSETGYKQEVARLRTTSTFVKVYDLIFEDILKEMVTKDDVDIEGIDHDLEKVCCERQETYIYTQLLIKRLQDEFGKFSFTRLKRDLELASIRNGNRTFVELLNAHLSDAPLEISRTIATILNSSHMTPADLITLKRPYLSSNPPSVHYLCNYDLMIKLLNALYVPQHGSIIRADMVDDVTFLLACASTMNDEQSLQAQQQEITQVQFVLRELYTALAPKTSVGSITGVTKYIVNALKYPISSMGLLLWIEYMTLETSYFENYFRTTETPILHIVLDVIANRHKLQQPVVFDVIKKCIKHKYNHFAPEIQMALQRTWVDRMLYLVQLNYTTPVLKYFEKEGKELDNSIIIHFVKKLLKLTQGPYSIAFTEHLINIIGHLGENLALIKDIQKSLNDFFEQVINGPYPIDESLQQSIRAIRKHF